MQSESDLRTWRWIALVATVVNIAFNNFSQRLPFGEGTVREISQRYPSLFTPAGYAFAIWGLFISRSWSMWFFNCYLRSATSMRTTF